MVVRLGSGKYCSMQVRTKITLCISILAAVIITCAGLLLWNTQRSTYNHQRSTLAYQQLAGYLQFSSELFRTFKQVRRDLMDGGGVLAFDLDEAEQRLIAIVDDIRMTEVQESQAVGLREDEVYEDQNRLNALQREVSGAFDDIRRGKDMLAAGKAAEARLFISATLTERIDVRISQIIEEAVEDEREEVAEALAQIELVNRIAFWVAIAATVTGLPLTALVVYTLLLRLRRNLSNLERGAEIFGAGQLDHKIPVHGKDEFAKLSHRFNAMAHQLQEQHQALEDARISLEHRVEERTEELRAANAELERRDEMRRQFFADIGHELRTPITAVRGEAEVALRARSDHRETYRSALDRIVEISGQLTRFVNDIFLIARAQAGVADMRRAEVDLNEVINMAVGQLRTLTEEYDAQLTLDVPESPAMVEGDMQRLCQLLQILLSNAVKHSQPGVRIEIALRLKANDWRLSVSDNGPGIPMEERPHVFDRFYRGGASVKPRPAQGTGLGLPIAKSIVQGHDGRIRIDPIRQGTAVHVSLPVSQLQPSGEQASEQKPSPKAARA